MMRRSLAGLTLAAGVVLGVVAVFSMGQAVVPQPQSTPVAIQQPLRIVSSDGGSILEVAGAAGAAVPVELQQAIQIEGADETIAAVTIFRESLTGWRNGRLALVPVWGTSEFRDDTSGSVGGGSVAEADGELVVSSGETANSKGQIATRERLSYQPGSTANAGIGVRFTSAPVGTQYAEWGLFDATNGPRFGYDALGPYVRLFRGGVEVFIARQAEWNIDKMDGTGTSGATLDMTGRGYIYTIEQTWYGYGPIRWFISAVPGSGGVQQRFEVHRYDPTGNNSLIDPNLPVTCLVANGSAGGKFTMYVGGRQASLNGGYIATQTRSIPEEISGYTLTAAQNTWEPLIAVRLKATHGPSNRTNSVLALYESLQASSTQPCVFRVTYNGVSAGQAWAAPTDWDAAESALETRVRTRGTLTASTVGKPIVKVISDAGRNTQAQADDESVAVLGQGVELILWAKPTSVQTTVVSAILTVTEKW